MVALLWSWKDRFLTKVKKYSVQLSFAIITFVFLTVTVGEGQAYQLPTPKLEAEATVREDGFIGRPTVFVGQTLLTGEVQQLVAINYKIEEGDSLVAIAARYNISVGSIIQANNIPINQVERLKPGTTILIPATELDTSLAWLERLNEHKEQERLAVERARLEQLRRDQERARRIVDNRPTVRLAQAIGGHIIIGTFRNLPPNGAVPGQCTYWVKHKRPDLPWIMGNGGQYLAFARRHGIPTGTVPRVGAVIVTSESPFGHVGIVIAVGDGTVTISEMNYVGPFIVSQRTIPTNSPVIRGYVY